MKKLLRSLVPILLLLFSFPSRLRAETVVDNDIKHDAVWTAAGAPYVITNDIVLEEGVSLRIEPGTLIRIHPEKTIEVKGDFRAVGTAEQPIVFTAYGEGAWGNIYFTDFSNDATFTDAGQYTGGCILSHCIIEKGDGLFIRFGAPLVTQCEIRNNISSGIRVEFGGPRIIGNRIYANSTVQDPASGNGAGIIAYTDKDVVISDNIIYDNISDGGRDGGGGIYAYAADNAVITITNNTIFGNTSSRFAGGIYAYKGILKGNSVFNNKAVQRGGGIMQSNAPSWTTSFNGMRRTVVRAYSLRTEKSKATALPKMRPPEQKEEGSITSARAQWKTTRSSATPRSAKRGVAPYMCRETP